MSSEKQLKHLEHIKFRIVVVYLEEEKLKFYITSCSFCLCNSACSLQSLDYVGHMVSKSGDSQY